MSVSIRLTEAAAGELGEAAFIQFTNSAQNEYAYNTTEGGTARILRTDPGTGNWKVLMEFSPPAWIRITGVRFPANSNMLGGEAGTAEGLDPSTQTPTQ
ncbi:hypothetical protein H9639_01440 [Arthrobacter sp. Sa2CUA1]|uniref:Uncharacterized protein n=1 Tax=Arthrobacter gallicola TaxID=2762225 RepID=A0ABR8UNK6_9MICC|nr:hypothetical protein [Arthrobacter gallicola]MBD7993962.1 hypothetical protein [Arthrobacter gallicola]